MTALTTPVGATSAQLPRLPSAVSTSLARGGLEIRSFFRHRDSVLFTFGLPVILLVIFGQIFRGDIGHTGVAFRQYFAAGIIATGIMSVTFVNLGVSIAVERDTGALKRLAGTPLPPVAYFAGKAISALVISALETAVTLGAGVALLGLRLPDSAGKWATLGWVFALGVVTCSLLGIAVSSIPRSAQSASAVVNLPYLVLSFISGVYFVFSSLPQSLQHIAAIFPLKWMCQGLRSVFRLAAQTTAELGIKADLQIRGPRRELATGAQVVLLRVCQEALSNVRKHAAAHRAQIMLSYDSDAVRLEVRDDGAGFDPARASGGFGLRGMHGRVAEAGGSLSVRSEPGAGATVTVEVPA